MPSLVHSVIACVIGFTAAYFFFTGIYLSRLPKKTRLQQMAVWIFAIWSVNILKDVVLPIWGYHNNRLLTFVFFFDGWLELTFTAFLLELSYPQPYRPGRDGVFPRYMWYLSAPYLLFTVAQLIVGGTLVMQWYGAFLITFGLTIVTICVVRAHRYTIYLKEQYADITHRATAPIIYTIITLAFFLMVSWLIISLVNNPWLDILYYAACIATWAVAIHLIRDLQPVEELTPVTAEPCPLETRSFPFEQQLQQAIDRDAVYLQPSLTLQSLATMIGTNRTYLSRYLCEVKQTNFYDYINSLRVLRHSVPLLTEHPEYTLEYIALKSGFNSLSTFLRAFRKYTGMSPGQYRNR